MAKKIIKTIVISKQIHSCFASFSSRDEFVQVITNSKEIDFKPVAEGIITSKKFPMLNGETIKEISGDKEYCGLYLNSDETFYNIALRTRNHNGFSDTPEFKALVQSYLDKGFIDDKKYIHAQQAYWEREEEKSIQESKKKGIVLWMGYDDYKGHPEYFQGGFSNEVFNSKELYNYVKKGSCYGWIGHSGARTSEHDKQIESGLRKRGISPSKMCNWISSGDGRHFGDSLEGYTKKEQKKKISEKLNAMYNKCIIYGVPEHKGTLNSSISIEDNLKELNILLPYHEKYNHKKHLENLLKSQEILSSKETLTEFEEYISDIIKDIFANKV